jgi:hypothetical protein
MRRRLSGLWMVINPKFRNLKSSSCSSSVHWDGVASIWRTG